MRTRALDETPLSNALLEQVLTYARRGWAVLPVYEVMDRGDCACQKADCSDRGKHQRTPHGVKDATKDEGTIRGWWTKWPNANVAIATGTRSGLVVLDIDPRHQGEKSLDALESKYGPLPKTPRAKSGGNGEHIYLQHPGSGHTVRNVQGLGGFSGIDLKGDGGYVIADPSRHASGQRYRWRQSSHPDLRAVAPAPLWVVDLSRAPSSEIHPERGHTRDWLKLLQGVEAGQRHTVAAQIAGHYLGIKWKPQEVETLLLGFASQCSPPHDPEDIRRIVSDLAAVETGKATARRSATQPGSGTPPWPLLKAQALHGLAGEIVRTIDPHTEADQVAVLVTILTAFGNVVGDGPHFLVEATSHPCRLYTVLVGQTAKARKGTAWSTPRHMFSQIDKAWLDARVTGGLSTGEGLINAVRDRRVESRPVKEKGRVAGYEDIVADQGEEDKRLFVVEEEFVAARKVMKREGNILSPVIRQAWDSGNLRPLTKNNPIRATGAHISILGHITQDELLRHLNDIEQGNGFANRFIWVLVKRSKVLPHPLGTPTSELQPLVSKLAACVKFARTSNTKTMVRTPDAEQLWAQIYPGLSEGKPGLLGAILARAEIQVLRLACIYALLDREPMIAVVHLHAAVALWEYAAASATRIFGTRLGNPDADRILATLRQRAELTETDIHDLFNRHKPAAEIQGALEVIASLGLATRYEEDTGGRPRAIWRMTSHETKEN